MNLRNLFIFTSVIGLVGTQAKLQVSVKEGEVATLPCDVSAPMNRQTSVDGLFIRWVHNDEIACDFDTGKTYCHGGYSNRAEISMNNMNFLLIIHNTRFSDRGKYFCWLQKPGDDHAIHVTTVNLVLQGHKKTVSVFWGKSLEIYLPMTENVRVQFTAARSSTRAVWCIVQKNMLEPGCVYEPRAEVVGNALRLDSITFADEGIYTVTDIRKNLIMNTVVLEVKGIEENRVLEEGQNLSVSLHSLNSFYVEFWGETKNSKAEVCEVKGQAIHPGSGYLHRLTLLNGSLILSSLTAKDHGKYIVRKKMGERPILTLSLNISPKINPLPAGKHVIDWGRIGGIAAICVFLLLVGIGIPWCVHKWRTERMEREKREKLKVSSKSPCMRSSLLGMLRRRKDLLLNHWALHPQTRISHD